MDTDMPKVYEKHESGDFTTPKHPPAELAGKIHTNVRTVTAQSASMSRRGTIAC